MRLRWTGARLALVALVAGGCHLDQLVGGSGPRAAPARGGPTAPGPATSLAFTVQPVNSAALGTIRPPVQVTAYDSAGNVLAGFTGTVRVAIGRDASLLGNATLSGTTTVKAVAGVATFGDLSIDQVGSGYTLTAAFGGGAPVATSAAFSVGL